MNEGRISWDELTKDTEIAFAQQVDNLSASTFRNIDAKNVSIKKAINENLVSIEDWKTGFISIVLNVGTFIIAGLFAFFNNIFDRIFRKLNLNFLCNSAFLFFLLTVHFRIIKQTACKQNFSLAFG